MDHKKSTGDDNNWRMPSKGSLQYRLFIRRLISLRREPVVQAYHYRELAVPANLGQLRNQQAAGAHKK
jgi:hypothetical protein